MRGSKPMPDAAYNARWFQRLMRRTIVTETGCFLWQGHVTTKGYGGCAHRKYRTSAHRIAYMLTHGVVLRTEEFVCHTCDNRRCWNPAHLWVGDNSANQRDAARKGRHQETKKTHCPRGHAYDAENTYRTPQRGLRNCKLCARIRQRIKMGWPEHLALSLPKTPHGQRPVGGRS